MQPTKQAPVSFYALGDMPYTSEEDAMFPVQVQGMAARSTNTDGKIHGGEFIVHVGDFISHKEEVMMEREEACPESRYQMVANVLKTGPVRTFMIPGDNDWNDCPSPDTAMKYWQDNFRHLDNHWKNTPADADFPEVTRHPSLDPNFAFRTRHVLSVGVFMVAGRINNQTEWDDRQNSNIDFLQENLDQHKQDISVVVVFGHTKYRENVKLFFDRLSEVAQANQGLHFMYLHGDGHVFEIGYNLGANNLLRVQVDKGGIAPPLHVTIHPDGDFPYDINRQLW